MNRLLVLGLSLVSLCYKILIVHAVAAPLCDREDVDYYLSKGFTQTQITAICSGAPQVIERVVQSAPAAAGAAAGAANDDAQFLSLAIDGYDVVLSEDQLEYTREICVKYGERDSGGFQDKFCPAVQYIIALKDLKVLDTGKRFLIYGRNKVIVSGDIKRRILDAMDGFNDKQRQEINAAMEKGQKTEVPVRSGIPLERVALTLKRIAS